MKTLTLLRHAKSGWDDPVSRDFDRPLNARGKRGASIIGEHMRAGSHRFDYVVSSPAVRCVDTLDAIWEGYGQILHPKWDRRIYLASAATLLDVVQELPESARHVLLCGHNPGLEDLALMLVPDRKEDLLRSELEEKFPTGTLAELQFPLEKWADIRVGSGILARFIRPRDLDPSLAPDPA